VKSLLFLRTSLDRKLLLLDGTDSYCTCKHVFHYYFLVAIATEAWFDRMVVTFSTESVIQFLSHLLLPISCFIDSSKGHLSLVGDIEGRLSCKTKWKESRPFNTVTIPYAINAAFDGSETSGKSLLLRKDSLRSSIRRLISSRPNTLPS
jgi:hypothetical protein